MARKLTRKSGNSTHRKPYDDFWRLNFMKVLDCLQNEELTWSRDNWQKYGVSNADRALIEQEFQRWQSMPHNRIMGGKIYNAKGKLIGERG